MRELICFLVIGIILIYMYREQSYVPKKIWTYWDNPDTIPKTVKKCMATWAKWNPHDEIVLLTKKNYKGYVRIPEELCGHPNFHERLSDLIRIWTLAEHGGIWMDSSTILNMPLSWVFPWYAETKEFSGFYLDGFTKNQMYPVIENWFLACRKGSEFMKRWRDEFSQMARYPSVEVYVKSRIRMDVDPQGIKDPIDMAVHIAAQKVIQIDRYPIDTLLLRKAEDGSVLNSYTFSKEAPFEYLAITKWDSEKAVGGLCNRVYPIITLREKEQKILEGRDDIMMCF